MMAKHPCTPHVSIVRLPCTPHVGIAKWPCTAHVRVVRYLCTPHVRIVLCLVEASSDWQLCLASAGTMTEGEKRSFRLSNWRGFCVAALVPLPIPLCPLISSRHSLYICSYGQIPLALIPLAPFSLPLPSAPWNCLGLVFCNYLEYGLESLEIRPQLGQKKVWARTDCAVVRILEALLGPGMLGTWVGRSWSPCSGLSDVVGQEEACSLAP